ncbi:MAG: PAS domain S-box protein [Xanthomonadales bacterium]|nr:PAS domain S-box protein [Xanthomonadales bacterium]
MKSDGAARRNALRRLRRAALARIGPQPGGAGETERLMHELQLHEVELEMQNEELRQALISLEESRDRYLELYDSAPSGFISLDAEGMVIEANLTTCKLFRITRSDLVGSRFARLIAPEQREQWYEFFHQRLESQAGNQPILQICRGDGSRAHVQAHALARREAAGDRGLSLCLADWTEQTETEASRQAMSQLLATLSHELRGPLNGIFGMTELALEAAEDPQQQRWLGQSLKSARHLHGIINRVLDYTLIQEDRLEPNLAVCSVSEVIDDAIAMLLVLARSKGLEITARISPSVPEQICTDAAFVRQILINLIDNAIKFSSAGVIHVVARLTSDSSDRNLLQIQVIDQGIGIDESLRARLFEAYSRADASTDKLYPGTGLGLYLSRQFARALGGDLTVIGSDAAGSAFSLTIPWLEAAPGK